MWRGFICLSGSALGPRRYFPRRCWLLLPPAESRDRIIPEPGGKRKHFEKGKERQTTVAPGNGYPTKHPSQDPSSGGPAAPPRCERKCSQSDEEGWVLTAETCLHDSNRITLHDSGRHSSRRLTCENINPVHSATAPFEDETTISGAPCFHKILMIFCCNSESCRSPSISAPLGMIREPVLLINQTAWDQTQAQMLSLVLI